MLWSCWKHFQKFQVGISTLKYVIQFKKEEETGQYMSLCSKLTIKTQERCQWHNSGVATAANFEQIQLRHLGAILEGSPHRKSPWRSEQDSNLRRIWVQGLLTDGVQ